MALQNRTKSAFLALGFDTNLILKIEAKFQTLSSLRGYTNDQQLTQLGFTEDESKFIRQKVNREPIEKVVIDEALKRSGECCCYCKDGNSLRPYQIHHITEYHVSQDNSLNNLMLVCPTHHVAIHKNKYSRDQQLETREKWEQIQLVAAEYKQRGFSFPFGEFVSLIYLPFYDVLEIFGLGTPRNSTSLELTRSNLASSIAQHLTNRNHALLVGYSGNGKSTLARGIAGRFKDTHKIFENVPSNKTGSEQLADLALFISQVTVQSILIIDDANRNLNDRQIEELFKASSSLCKVIVIITKDSYNSDGNIEQHLLHDRFIIAWSEIQHSIKLNLMRHENEIVTYLTSQNAASAKRNDLGLTRLAGTLEELIRIYTPPSVNNVWQFVYLLSGGIGKLSIEFTGLFNNSRFDIVILKVAINQIADFERGTSVDELLKLYETNATLKALGAPDNSWLKDELEKVCAKRFLKKERGTFKTIHRELAKEFINLSYQNLSSRPDCEGLLNEIFNDYAVNVRRIFILLNWLKRTSLSDYTTKWGRNLSNNDWHSIASLAADDGLQTLSLVAEDLNYKIGTRNDETIRFTFLGLETKIANIIIDNEQNTFHRVNELFSLLTHGNSAILQNILDGIPIENFVSKIRNASPYEFWILSWSLNSAYRCNPRWVSGLSGTLDFKDIQVIVNKIEMGHAKTVHEIYEFQKNYISKIKRSELKFYYGKFRELLINCPLSKIHFPETIQPEFYLFPNEIDRVIDALNEEQVASELEEAVPRSWGNLLSLCLFASYGTSHKIEAILERVNEEKLFSNVEQHYLTATYEFRVLIHTIRYGSHSKRNKFALLFSPLVENILVKYPAEKDPNDVLYALYNLNTDVGKALCEKLQKEIPKLSQHIPISDEAQQNVQIAEGSGQDYDI